MSNIENPSFVPPLEFFTAGSFAAESPILLSSPKPFILWGKWVKDTHPDFYPLIKPFVDGENFDGEEWEKAHAKVEKEIQSHTCFCLSPNESSEEIISPPFMDSEERYSEERPLSSRKALKHQKRYSKSDPNI